MASGPPSSAQCADGGQRRRATRARFPGDPALGPGGDPRRRPGRAPARAVGARHRVLAPRLRLSATALAQAARRGRRPDPGLLRARAREGPAGEVRPGARPPAHLPSRLRRPGRGGGRQGRAPPEARRWSGAGRVRFPGRTRRYRERRGRRGSAGRPLRAGVGARHVRRGAGAPARAVRARGQVAALRAARAVRPGDGNRSSLLRRPGAKARHRDHRRHQPARLGAKEAARGPARSAPGVHRQRIRAPGRGARAARVGRTVSRVDDAALLRLRQSMREPDLSGTRYQLEGVAGAGGMGTVYAVLDTELGRRVALKVLDVHDPEVEARLRREAEVLARLEHPGIVPVHDVGRLGDGRAFYTMKLVQGERLDRYAARDPSSPSLLRVFLRIAEAVAFAHARGVLHRDLKPQNVMIGPFGEVLVLDWGLAKVLDDARAGASGRPASKLRVPGDTGEGAVLGTPGFMAPEQEAGASGTADARADVFSLGAVLQWLAAPGAP